MSQDPNHTAAFAELICELCVIIQDIEVIRTVAHLLDFFKT